MKILEELPTILILALVAFLAWIGYNLYQDYSANSDKAAPGTTPGSASAGSFGSYVDDSLFSIGQSSQDLATAQGTFFSHPFCSIGAIFGGSGCD